MPRHTQPGSPGLCMPTLGLQASLPSSRLTPSAAYLPPPLEPVISSLRFLGDSQAEFLISLPRNPFPSQSSPPQMLKPQSRNPLFHFPAYDTTDSTVMNSPHPKNNFPSPSMPRHHPGLNQQQHSSPGFVPWIQKGF